MCNGTLNMAHSVHTRIHTVSCWVYSAFLSTLYWCFFHSPFVTIICTQKDCFCINCGSHSSVDDDSSLLVYCTKLIGKMLLKCQSSMLPPSKGKGLSVHVIKVYWEFEVHLPYFKTSLLCGWLYALVFLTLGTHPPAPTEDAGGCIPKPV